jgi:hypothetical protein
METNAVFYSAMTCILKLNNVANISWNCSCVSDGEGDGEPAGQQGTQSLDGLTPQQRYYQKRKSDPE